MEVSAEQLLTHLGRASAPVVVDVRSGVEFRAGHVPGAVHMPFWSTIFRAGQLGARKRDPVVVYCGHGPRARMAAAALRLRGFRDVRLLCGHWSQWRRSGLPVER